MGDLELLTGTEMNIERSPGTVGDLREAAGVVVEMTCSEVLRTGGDLAMGIGMTSGGRQEDLQGDHHLATMEMVTEELYHLCHMVTGEKRRTGSPTTLTTSTLNMIPWLLGPYLLATSSSTSQMKR